MSTSRDRGGSGVGDAGDARTGGGSVAAGEAGGPSLGDLIAALVGRLGEGDPAALARLRQVVGARRARIALDGETVEVWFSPPGRLVAAAPGRPVDGAARTRRATTLHLLDGCLEVEAAILDGQLEVIGEVGDVVRIFQAIEILLDGAVRDPAMQALARDYRARSRRGAPLASGPPAPGSRSPAAPRANGELPEVELDLLRRLDLLP
jgi:hypothetical protein